MGTELKGIGRILKTACIVAMLLHGFWACAKPPAMTPSLPKPMTGAVRFTLLAPGATQVFLVGSFNGWAKRATPMKMVDGVSLWSVDVPLPEGEHTFMYVIDGVRWITPPEAEDFVTDGFGQTNGVVIVR
jgi:1,4-alpha-glucan branching enzyme